MSPSWLSSHLSNVKNTFPDAAERHASSPSMKSKNENFDTMAINSSLWAATVWNLFLSLVMKPLGLMPLLSVLYPFQAIVSLWDFSRFQISHAICLYSQPLLGFGTQNHFLRRSGTKIIKPLIV